MKVNKQQTNQQSEQQNKTTTTKEQSEQVSLQCLVLLLGAMAGYLGNVTKYGLREFDLGAVGHVFDGLVKSEEDGTVGARDGFVGTGGEVCGEVLPQAAMTTLIGTGYADQLTQPCVVLRGGKGMEEEGVEGEVEKWVEREVEEGEEEEEED